MNCELKQAAQQAVYAFDAFDDADDFESLFELTQKMQALRAAIQQAQQPATPEPAWFHKHWGDGDDIFYTPDDKIPPGSTPLYTRPSPSVQDDSKRLDYLQDRGATIDLIAGVTNFYPMRFRVGGLNSSANIDVRAAIDVARKAIK